MKKLIKKLPLVGFILAIGIAFAFSFANLDTAWFRHDSNGEPVGEALPGEPTCLENPQVECAGLYAIDAEGNPQGTAQQVEMGDFVSQ